MTRLSRSSPGFESCFLLTLLGGSTTLYCEAVPGSNPFSSQQPGRGGRTLKSCVAKKKVLDGDKCNNLSITIQDKEEK